MTTPSATCCNVLIAGGGTGGHIFPGIALAQELTRRSPPANVLFVGTQKGVEAQAVPKAGFKVEFLPVSGLRGKNLVARLKGLLALPMSLLQALVLVRRFRPQVAVSVGGFAAGPAVLAARLLGVPSVVMEQNAVAGVTNRILGRLAKVVVVALPTQGFAASKVMRLGNPTRSELIRVRHANYVSHKPMRVLVFGGSLGAKAINDAMVEAAPALAASGRYVFVHQTGRGDFERVAAAYKAGNAGESLKATAFIDDMAQAYENADVVVCRSGATTIAELTVTGRPSILIPFPHAVDDHQTANARGLSDVGAALTIPQPEFSAAVLTRLLSELSDQPERLKKMAQAARELGKPEAAARIVDVLHELVLKGAPHV